MKSGYRLKKGPFFRVKRYLVFIRYMYERWRQIIFDHDYIMYSDREVYYLAYCIFSYISMRYAESNALCMDYFSLSFLYK